MGSRDGKVCVRMNISSFKDCCIDNSQFTAVFIESSTEVSKKGIQYLITPMYMHLKLTEVANLVKKKMMQQMLQHNYSGTQL